MNIEIIQECNFGAFLDGDQFESIFGTYLEQCNGVVITDKILTSLFNAFDYSEDSRIFFSDFINVLSFIMFDNYNSDEFKSLYSRSGINTSGKEKDNFNKLLDKMAEYCVITFGIKPKNVNQEFEILTSLLEQHNRKLSFNTRPCLDEYNDFYYIVSIDWWNKYMQYLGTRCDLVLLSLLLFVLVRCKDNHFFCWYCDTNKKTTKNNSFSCKNDARLVKLEKKIAKMEDGDLSQMAPIDNRNLVDDFMSDQFVLRANLQANVDYIGISPSIWNVISNWYGGGCAIRRSVIGITSDENESESESKNDNSNDYVPYLELYPMKLFIHSKSNCETLDRQREVLENLKLEADYKRNIKDEMTKNNQNKNRRDTEISNDNRLTISSDVTNDNNENSNPLRAGDARKVSHIYNNLYYQWDVTVSSKTPFGYIAELICKYDPLVASINMKTDSNDNNEEKKSDDDDLFGVGKVELFH